MRIKSKLLVLMAVPLMALGAIATLGFRSQSVSSAAATSSQVRIDQTVAINSTMSAIAAERLGRLSNAPGDQLGALEDQTDAAFSSLTSLAKPVSSQELLEISQAVASARSATDPWQAATFYSQANTGLLEQNEGGAPDFVDGELLNSWIVSSLTAEASEAREQAWLNYFLEASTGTPNIAAVVTDFALADRAQEQAFQLSTGTDRSILESIQANETALELRTLEAQAVRDLRNGAFSVTASQMTSALTNNSTNLSAALTQVDADLSAAGAAAVTDSAAQRQLYSLLGIVGAIVLGGLVFVIYRSITNPLNNLLRRADHIANVQLPALVRKLRTTTNAESLPSPPQIPSDSSDEIGELVDAFNQMQTTAHTLATEQAISRRNVSDMFINLGRRNQQLLQRMLKMVTELEQDEADPDTLESLFALDQLVTRMRRNAESLLVLAGTQAPRQWSKPVSIENAVRGSIAEVEDYKRVEVAWLDPGFVQGSIVADVAHLVAELLENALAYSDPSMPVHINGEMTPAGYLLSVTDLGIGLDPEEIQDNNLRISSPPPLDQAPTRRLGLFVVGRLAERHGIQVQLVPGARQGIVARIEIPRGVLVMDSEPAESNSPSEAFTPTPIAEAQPQAIETELEALEAELFEPAAQAPQAEIFDYTQHDVDSTSPLGQKHDVDAELEELTSAPIQGWDDVPQTRDKFAAAPTPSAGSLPIRQAAVPSQPAPQQSIPQQFEPQQQAARQAQPTSQHMSRQSAPRQMAPEQPSPQQMPVPAQLAAQRPAPQQLAPQQQVSSQAAPLPVRAVAAPGQLPVRNPGSHVAAPADIATVAPAPARENTEAQASQFSSLMSAFSTGVSKGLEDSVDHHDAERRTQ